MRLVFCILAHTNRDCLADTVDSIRHYAPDARIVLFNGGHDSSFSAFGAQLGLDICPYSAPWTPRRLLGYHYGCLKYLMEDGRSFDFAVFLDSDMVLIRPGMDEWLATRMAEFDYVATSFAYLDEMDRAWEVGRFFLYHWERRWKHVLGDVRLARCFNPGQIFRRDLVERLLALPQWDGVLVYGQTTRLKGLDEIIPPTLAAAVGRPAGNPGSCALRLGLWPYDELLPLLDDPDAFLLHKVTMSANGPDRAYLRARRKGETPAPYSLQPTRPPQGLSRTLRSAIKTIYYRYFVDH